MKPYRYPWPASALDAGDMAALYHARESDPGRKPITQLIREAVQTVYGTTHQQEEKLAA
jgi:hypothetical protein